MQDFKKATVWQKSHLLAVGIYRTTESFLKDEICGLTAQIRRSCVSIPANIVEGSGREGSTEFKRFLQIALGSTTELEYQLLLVDELKFIDGFNCEQLHNQVSKVRRMLISLTKKVKE
jgi:four helix bundle protein